MFRILLTDMIYCFKNNKAYCLNTIDGPIIKCFPRHLADSGLEVFLMILSVLNMNFTIVLGNAYKKFQGHFRRIDHTRAGRLAHGLLTLESHEQ